jgi:ribose transport system substrate-binding protein
MPQRPPLRRRDLLGLLLASGLGPTRPTRAETRRWKIALANLDETPGVTLEGLGFTGADVRRSFEMAARTLPVDMVYYDNGGDAERAIANGDAAIAAKVDLLIEYDADAEANTEIARRLAAAHIPVFALVDPVPGAPLYGPDNFVAGRIAGRALGAFARETWPGEPVLGVLIGDFADPGPTIRDRARGITEGVRESLPGLKPVALDTGGQSVRADALLTKFLLAQSGRVLIGALDDLAAIYAARAIEMNRRQSDCIIVSQGLDSNIHGGASEKKAIDPNDRTSVVLGSVAYYMDRYGYEVLPLALRLLAGEKLPQRIVTQHQLITAENVFRAYPPIDMN